MKKEEKHGEMGKLLKDIGLQYESLGLDFLLPVHQYR